MKLSNKKILFVANAEKAGAGELAERLMAAAAKEGAQTRLIADPRADCSAFAGADAFCVIGGDGTILSCVPAAVKFGAPIFAVNLGKLGFMATFTDSISDESFADILGGDCAVDSRLLLEAEIGGETFYALNEFAVKSREQTVVNVSVKANGEFVALFTGDGVIFSTPTGSTAYNMSAGGPLLHPKAKAFALTSICPHTLSNRSIIFDDSTVIEVICDRPSSIIRDGVPLPLWDGLTPIKIKSSQKRVNFLRAGGYSHFSILRTKLGWGENPRETKNA
ncbi:MAG: NAD(+)/NADH kinase [Opitutales bacterium]|nr:NAD(+)/NADH kinase [Opitutales bacterium]